MQHDVTGIGNAIVDILAFADDSFLTERAIEKGSMRLIDEAEADALTKAIGVSKTISGGSAANTVVGIASFGLKAGFIGNILDNNLPADYVDQQNNIIRNITKTDIDALSKKWINAGKMNILVVGDKAKILTGLEKLGYEIIELDVDGKPVEKKAF